MQNNEYIHDSQNDRFNIIIIFTDTQNCCDVLHPLNEIQSTTLLNREISKWVSRSSPL